MVKILSLADLVVNLFILKWSSKMSLHFLSVSKRQQCATGISVNDKLLTFIYSIMFPF